MIQVKKQQMAKKAVDCLSPIYPSCMWHDYPNHNARHSAECDVWWKPCQGGQGLALEVWAQMVDGLAMEVVILTRWHLPPAWVSVVFFF